MNPNAKITDEQFEAYLKQIRELAEGPFEEMQKEIEVTNTFPEEFYELSKKNDLYRYYLPSEYGGWDLNELEILKVQEEFSRGPGGMRMHLHHAAQGTAHGQVPGQDHLLQLCYHREDWWYRC